jgi:hypothetical protein
VGDHKDRPYEVCHSFVVRFSLEFFPGYGDLFEEHMNSQLRLTTLLFLLLCTPPRIGAVDTQNIPDAGKAVSGVLAPSPGIGAQIVAHKGEWSVFASMEGDGGPIFLITGQLKNTSSKPLAYVKMQFELLDDEGVVIVRDYGYNRQAEALREEAYESGKKTLQDMGIAPLPKDTEDSFRFLFFKSDIPQFHSYRIRLLESK